MKVGFMELMDHEFEPHNKNEDLHQTPEACCLGVDDRFFFSILIVAAGK